MPDRKPGKRRVDSAAETRHLILDAALALFDDCGYGATTVKAIAGRAGVAVATVYTSVGGKPAVLAEIINAGTRDPEIEHSLQRVRQAPGMQLLRHRPSGLPVVLAAGHRDLRPLRPGPPAAGPLARGARLRHLLHRRPAPPRPVRLLRSAAAAGQPARPGRRHLRQLRRAARQQRVR